MERRRLSLREASYPSELEAARAEDGPAHPARVWPASLEVPDAHEDVLVANDESPGVQERDERQSEHRADEQRLGVRAREEAMEGRRERVRP